MKQKLLLGTLQRVAHVGATCARRLIKCKHAITKSFMWHGHRDIQSSEAASSSTATGRSRHQTTAATVNEEGLIAEGETALDLSLDLGLDPYLRLDRETEISLLRAVEQDFSIVTGAASQKHSNTCSSTSDYVPADVPDDTPNGTDASTTQKTPPDYWDTFTRLPPPSIPGRNLYNTTSRCTSVSPIEFDVDIAGASTGPTASIRSVDPRQPSITDLADACASLLDVKVREQELVLRRSMEASSDSESLIREWDRAQGLRFCHSKTTLATSRSRKKFVKTVFENEHEIPKKRGRPRKKKSNCTKESARRVICGISHAITSTFCPSGGSVSSPSDATPPRRVSESSEAA